MVRQNSISSTFKPSFEGTKQAAYKLLSHRDYTVFEITQKLSTKGYPGIHITQAIDFLKTQHYLDDRKYLQEWSRFRVERHHYGPIRLRAELLKKGFCRDDIDALIHQHSKEYHSVHQAKIALLHRYRDLSVLKEAKQNKRAFDFLRRKGHQIEDIVAVFREIEKA